MKLSHLFNTLPKRLATGALFALAVALPVATTADSMVNITGSTGVANASAGDTSFSSSVAASYNQVVDVQVGYYNNEAAGSNKIANNLRVKINIPNTPGVHQTITTKTSGDNTNTITGSSNVTLDGSDAYLQYIPGTATWKHADGQTGNTKTENVSDAVVTDPNGLVLENENPCQAGSVEVQARVMVPGVKIVKQSEILGQSNAWSNNNTANPGDTLKYMITYQNTGNTTQNNVVIRDNLPPNMTLVPGTTLVYTTHTPNGDPNPSNNITGGGINVGNYLPGAGAYVVFQVKVDSGTALTCGQNVFRNVGVATPQGMQDYYNIAVTTVNKTCAPKPGTPAYSCDLFHVSQNGQTVTVDQFQTSQSNGATFNSATINWGDSSTPLTTNKVIGQSHTYTGTTSRTLTATANFMVNGKTVGTVGKCTQTINFTTPTTPGTPTTLVNTGAGNVAALFAAITAAGAIGYRLFLSRKLAR